MNDVIWGGITVKEVLALLGGGIGVSIVVQVIKRFAKLDSPKVIQFVVVTASAVASGLGYLISSVHSLPSSVASHFVGLLGIANAAHTFIVSDADQFIQKVRTALNSESTTTATPAVTEPVVNATPTEVEASASTPPAASF